MMTLIQWLELQSTSYMFAVTAKSEMFVKCITFEEGRRRLLKVISRKKELDPRILQLLRGTEN